MKRTVYLDNAATTKVDPDVLEVMLPYWKEEYGNPSSIYQIGSRAKAAIEEARAKVAEIFHAKPKEIYFTSCGTESDNWAIISYALANRTKGNHIITSKIEHHAVLHSCAWLEKNGYEVTYLDVDEYGRVSVDDFREAIRTDTILASIMFANNEIGTIQPIRELAEVAHEKDIFFHTDAVQAIGDQEINVQELGVDAFSLSGHKIHGPKGIGMLYLRQGIKLPAYIHGGAQERNKRAGTENVAFIVGLAKAIEKAYTNREERLDKIREVRDYLREKIEAEIPHIRFNGHPTDRLANNLSVCFEFIEGESLLLMLDMEGIAGSSGSACTSGSLDPSHVLLAIGLPHEIAHGSLRLSLSEETTKAEIDYVVEKLAIIVDRLRQMSPLYEKVGK